MKHVIYFLLFIGFMHANEINFENVNDLYRQDNNIWLKSLSNHRANINLLERKSELEDKLQKAIDEQDEKNIIAITDAIKFLKESLKVHENRTNLNQPFFELSRHFEVAASELDSMPISFVTIFSKKAETILGYAQKEWNDLNLSFKQAQETLNDFKNKLEILLKTAKDEDKEKISLLLLKINQDIKLLNLVYESVSNSYDQLVISGQITEKIIERFKIEQWKKGGLVFIVIGVLFAILLISRFIISLYRSKETDDEEYYQRLFILKKALNIIFVISVLLVIGFTYIGNIAQSLAIFGVIGAGLTIVSKEIILSFFGWLQIMTSGIIRIGDRIKMEKNGQVIIGDVINISLTRLTLYENITNNAQMDLKRAGRIIFVPNHYIITQDVYNYTHMSMKTIVDLIEFNVSFDTDLEKLEQMLMHIATTHTGRYMGMAKRNYDALKERYTLRNMITYPRVVFYPSIRGDGITVGIWYVAPYREILNSKTIITKNIMKAIKDDSEITLMYSGNSLHIETKNQKIVEELLKQEKVKPN